MTDKPRYSIKTYLLLLVVAPTLGVILMVAMLLLIGFGSQGALVVVVLSFPVWLFSILYGFYKGLVRSYGLSGSERLIFDGKI